MAIALACTNFIGARRRSVRHFSLTFSGSYTAGGDTLNFTAATNPGFIPAALAIGRLPDAVAARNIPAGFVAEVIPGTTLANYKLKLYTANKTEMAAGAYDATLTAAGAAAVEVVSRNNV